MKDALVIWDKSIFDGENKLLPNSDKLYTQIHGVPAEEDSWSVVLDFKETPRNQGYKSKAKVKFLVDEAPHDILKPGFKFTFFDGSKKIGICEIINANKINISDIQTRINLIEDEKNDFRIHINSLKVENIVYKHNNELEKIVRHSDNYPYLFSLVLRLKKEIALGYLEKYFFNLPIESNAAYHSNLPLFLFVFKEIAGEEELKNYIDCLSDEIKNNHIVVNALEEVL